MPIEDGAMGPHEEAHGLVMVPDEHEGRFRSRGAGGTFTLDILITSEDAAAFRLANTDEEKQAIVDKYVEAGDVDFDTKAFRILRGALLGSTLVYEVDEVSRSSTLDL